MSINIDDLTPGQIKQIQSMAQGPRQDDAGLCGMLGQKVIIRTYAAGCWFGVLAEKSGEEVILKNARRMWFWQASEGISLSACALYGVDRKKSKIVEPVAQVWLKAIEILPCTTEAIESLEGVPHVKAG